MAATPNPNLQPPYRIAVIGTTGSGKTTVAARLATRLAIPHIELDALHWGPQWTPVPRELFRERTAAAVAAPAWVSDGNYHRVRDLVWGRAATLVWLDYPFGLVLYRLLRRTLQRAHDREELWAGNRERLQDHFFSRDSLFLWAVRTHWRHRREVPAVLAEEPYRHLRLVHLRSPKATQSWLQGAPAVVPLEQA